MNALKELKNLLEDHQLTTDDIRCAHISFSIDVFDEDPDYIEYQKELYDDFKEFILLEAHSSQDINDFLKFMNTEYDDGYGGQNLFGKVWFYDNSWIERHEYDGAEWWEYKKFNIPEYLQK